MNTFSTSDLKALTKSGGALPADAAVRKDFAILEKAVDGDALTADFVVSTATIDRHGDRILIDGWRLDRYRENPVVAWDHNYSLLPVARCLSIAADGDRLRARLQFDADDPFSRKIFGKIQGGFLGSCSVGFIPLAFDWADEPGREFGWDIKAAELLEVSIVSIPANPQALIERRAAPEPVAATAEESSVVPPQFLAGSRKRAERLRLHFSFHRSFI